MSLSETYRISGDNASAVGVSQFPAYLATLALKEVAPQNVETPAKDTAYKFYLAQNNKGEILYFAGAMSGNFLATTTKISKATDVYLEEVLDGETVIGFRLYFMDGETKKYIDAHEYQAGKVGIQLTETPTCTWTFNSDLGVLTTVVCAKTWYLGTYSTYNTMSLSETYRISGDNASAVGVSQFPAYLATIEIVNDHVCEFAAATCVKPATCKCGKTQGEALGHNIADNVCTNCGAKVVTLTEAKDLEDGTLVLVEVTVTKITFSWSDTNKNMSVDVTDGTTTLNAYKLATKVGVGDIIVIYGKMGSYNEVKQIAEGAIAEIKTAHVCSEYTAATCKALAACVVCGATTGEYADHIYGTDGVCTVEGCGVQEGVTQAYNKVTSSEQFTTGTYVLIGNTSHVTFSAINGTSWVVGETLEAGNTIAKANGDNYAITLTVTDAGVTIKIGDKYIAPKGGNNNGLKIGTTEYNWAYSFDENGNITFKGVGDDTVTLAYNSTNSSTESIGPAYRGYKNTTVASYDTYYTTFVAYKLG